MRRRRRIGFPALIVGCAVLAPGWSTAGASADHASASSRASAPAGTWRVTVSRSCHNTPRNSTYCGLLFGPGTAAVGTAGTTLREQYTETVAADSRGRYTSASRDALSERTSGRAGRPNCTDEGYITLLFNGVCRSRAAAKGVIKRSDLGRVPDFWETERHVTMEGSRPHVKNEYNSTGLDTHIPAVAGVYGTRAFLEMYRLLKPGAPLPAGVSVHIAVAHLSPRAGS